MLKNVGSNWIVTLVTIAVTYFLMPFVLHTLGQDGYGTWALINSITGYLALLALGVPMASVRYFAEHAADRDPQKLNRAIASCTALYLAIGVVALLVGLALFPFFSLTYDLPAAWRSDAHLAFFVVVISVALGFVAMLP